MVMAAWSWQHSHVAPHLHLVLTLVVAQLDDLDGVAKDEAAGGKLSHLVSGVSGRRWNVETAVG